MQVESLQDDIEENMREIDQLQAANSEIKNQHANYLQTILIEMKELEQRNAEYRKQLEEGKQERTQRGDSNPRSPAGVPLSIFSFSLHISLNVSHFVTEITLGNEQLEKILGMLQNIHALCSNAPKLYVPPIEEIIEKEKRKLEEEHKALQQQLVLEKRKKEEALHNMSSQPEHPGTPYLKLIESTRKKLEEMRNSTQMVLSFFFPCLACE